MSVVLHDSRVSPSGHLRNCTFWHFGISPIPLDGRLPFSGTLGTVSGSISCWNCVLFVHIMPNKSCHLTTLTIFYQLFQLWWKMSLNCFVHLLSFGHPTLTGLADLIWFKLCYREKRQDVADDLPSEVQDSIISNEDFLFNSFTNRGSCTSTHRDGVLS